MITHNLDKNNIFCIKLTGIITYEDINDFLIEFKSFNKLPEDVLLLYDLFNAEFKISPQDIESISKLADVATRNYKSVKTAFLVDKPMVTAFSSLFADIKDDEKKERKIFSTEEAARNWLLGKIII
jgi:hypothetical protein